MPPQPTEEAVATHDPQDAVALRMVPGLGDRAYRLLIDRFGSAGSALSAPLAEIREAIGPGGRADWLKVLNPDRREAARTVDNAARIGAWTLTYGEPGYPEALAAIHDPPSILYGRGKLEGGERGRVAVVGSRRASRNGLTAARLLSCELARENLAVVSGLAEGIDTQAHCGALEGSGRTIAVLGSGLDNLYPRSNLKLAEEIIEKGGAVITEQPPGASPEAKNFPKRNRIISGLSLGVVIVEAAAKSGSLITASLALEQGREVFAMPGQARSTQASGVNNLLRQGAPLAETGEDVLFGLGLESLHAAKAGGKTQGRPTPPGEAGKMLEILTNEPIDVDTLALRAGLDPAGAAAALIELTLLGQAVNWPGSRYSLPIT